MFFWMQNPPDTVNILGERWSEYLDTMASACLFVVIVFVVLTLLLYSSSAARKKIRLPADVFAPYTPIYWLCLSIPAGILMAVICVWTFADMLGDKAGGIAHTAATLALWAFVWTLLLSYLGILIPGITPPKFRYRPLWLFYWKKGVRT
jgi:hypothetical protein